MRYFNGLASRGALTFFSDNVVLPHCKFALTDHAERSFLAGMCVGSIRAIARLAATPRASVLCAALPDSVTPEQMVRVVVRYIEARPQRMHEAFFVLAIEALLDAWPCPPQQPRP